MSVSTNVQARSAVPLRDVVLKVLRSAARNRVIKKRLPRDLGGNVVFCSPDALLSTWKPGWRSAQSLNLFQWARRYVQPGDVVWDIGANQGLFSFAAVAASAPNGHVVAFEPDPFLAGLLHRTRANVQDRHRINVMPLAVAATPGLSSFSIASKDRALNHLSELSGNAHTGGERDRFAVVTVTLGWLAHQLRPPDLIKVDVEGGELNVLRGAGDILLRVIRPRWIVEVAPENSEQVAALLRREDYRLFNANGPDSELQNPAWNTLAIPAERL